MYPSNELHLQWLGEWLLDSEDDQGRFLIRKACDWQREQDALICEKLYPQSGTMPKTCSDIASDCAKAIREAGNE